MSDLTFNCETCEDEGVYEAIVTRTLENPQGIERKYCDCRLGQEREAQEEDEDSAKYGF